MLQCLNTQLESDTEGSVAAKLPIVSINYSRVLDRNRRNSHTDNRTRGDREMESLRDWVSAHQTAEKILISAVRRCYSIGREILQYF